MARYSFGGTLDSPGRISRFGKPTPLHAQRAAEARERMAPRSVARLPIVTDHGMPPAYRSIPKAALDFAKRATAAGFDVRVDQTRRATVVSGWRARTRQGFRAVWTAGRSTGGTWHEPKTQWRLVDISDRPIGVDAVAKTTKVGCRHDESDTTRLVLVSSPRGVPCNITEIERRISA